MVIIGTEIFALFENCASFDQDLKKVSSYLPYLLMKFPCNGSISNEINNIEQTLNESQSVFFLLFANQYNLLQIKESTRIQYLSLPMDFTTLQSSSSINKLIKRNSCNPFIENMFYLKKFLFGWFSNQGWLNVIIFYQEDIIKEIDAYFGK